MDGLPGMHGVKVVTGAAAAVLLMAYVGQAPALADTIEAALVRAYQNNPQLNAQQTANRTRAAESQVSGSREALRFLESSVLFSAATIYMDYLRDAAIVEVQRSNVRVLEQTLKQTRDRFNVGEVTRTDVAQSEAQLAAGKTQLLAAEATLTTTRSNFRRIIGNEPEALAPGSPVDRFLPGTLPAAVELGLVENPNVTAAMFGIDVNFLQVKVNEGALLPTLSLQVGVQQAYEQQMT